MINTEQFIQTNGGRCIGCGELTLRYSTTRKWFICVYCSEEGDKMTDKKAGAPLGNQNAKKETPRIRLSVRIDTNTLAWLERQAAGETDGNVGRWLDALAYKFT